MKSIQYVFLLGVFMITISCGSKKIVESNIAIEGQENREAFGIQNIENNVFSTGIYKREENNKYKRSFNIPESDFETVLLDPTPVICLLDIDHIEVITTNYGDPALLLHMIPEAYSQWKQITIWAYENREKLYVVIDGEIILAPLVQSPIENGIVMISGVFVMENAQEIKENIMRQIKASQY